MQNDTPARDTEQRSALLWILPSLHAAVSIAWGLGVWRGHWANLTPAMGVVTALSVGATLVAAIMGWRSFVTGRLAVTVTLMLGTSLLIGLRALDRCPVALDGMPNRGYAAFISLVALAAAVGIVRRMFWARWIAFAFCVGASLCGVINGVGLYELHDERAWVPVIGFIAGGAAWIHLAHPSVREHFLAGTGNKHELWISKNPIIRASRWAAISNFAAVPMLLLYGLTQPVVKETVTTGFVLAALLGIGAALVVARKVVGVLLLGVSGIGLLVQSAATLAVASNFHSPATREHALWIAEYYVAFWFPAGLLGILAAFLVLRHKAPTTPS